MSQIGFIIQARLGSSRLPNKMRMPFYKDESIPEIIINKIKNRFPDIDVVLATSDSVKDNYFEEFEDKFKIKIFRGNEDDVLRRFIGAANFYNYDKVIRICADNPFLDMDQLEYLINSIDDSDYISFQVNDNPSIKTHFGFWAEYVTIESLQKIDALTQENFYREHVTNYIYTHAEKFKFKFLTPLKIVDGRDDIRMTIDTKEDFENLSLIYKNLRELFPQGFGIKEIINFLNQNPQLTQLMKNQIEQNSK